MSEPAMRPFVAVVGYRLPRGRVGGWDRGAFAVPDAYVEALWRAGVEPAAISPDPRSSVADALEAFPALVLLGGGDVDPARYGAERHAAVYGVDPYRDEIEIRLVREAIAADVPVFAICRGMQVLNVACGGTLIQHLPDVPGTIPHRSPGTGRAAVHDVKLSGGSRVEAACAREAVATFSHHHQALDRLGEGFSAVAWTNDGIVEAIEHEQGWVVGVQWHPEETAETDPAQQALFDAFAEQARVRANERSTGTRSRANA